MDEVGNKINIIHQLNVLFVL